MKWIAKPTGDMTLSVLNEAGKQILKIDMLKYNTMKAEQHGKPLFVAMNDLQIIANFTDEIYDVPPKNGRYKARHEHSPFPWSYTYDEKKRRLIIRNASGDKICDKEYPKTFKDDEIASILSVIENGIKEINSSTEVIE